MAKLTPGSFAKKLRAFAKDLPRQQNEIKKEVAREITINLVNATPKDTGEAASNWQVGKSPVTSVTANISRNGDPALLRLGQFLASVKPGDTIYITNNTRHIGILNQGYSTQAPAGFIEVAIKNGKALISKQRIRYGV